MECMMQLNPYLTFNGQCEEAFKFYEKCLGGKIVMMMTFGDSPMAEQAPPDWRKKIIHATLALGDHVLSGSDAPPDRYKKPQGFFVTLGVDAAAEADRIFKALAENGAVEMPIQETFWALRFGMLVDQFGTPWMINCSKPM
jgi:PhnB protein